MGVVYRVQVYSTVNVGGWGLFIRVLVYPTGYVGGGVCLLGG